MHGFWQATRDTLLGAGAAIERPIARSSSEIDDIAENYRSSAETYDIAKKSMFPAIADTCKIARPPRSDKQRTLSIA